MSNVKSCLTLLVRPLGIFAHEGMVLVTMPSTKRKALFEAPFSMRVAATYVPSRHGQRGHRRSRGSLRADLFGLAQRRRHPRRRCARSIRVRTRSRCTRWRPAPRCPITSLQTRNALVATAVRGKPPRQSAADRVHDRHGHAAASGDIGRAELRSRPSDVRSPLVLVYQTPLGPSRRRLTVFLGSAAYRLRFAQADAFERIDHGSGRGLHNLVTAHVDCGAAASDRARGPFCRRR